MASRTNVKSVATNNLFKMVLETIKSSRARDFLVPRTRLQCMPTFRRSSRFRRYAFHRGPKGLLFKKSDLNRPVASPFVETNWVSIKENLQPSSETPLRQLIRE